MLPQSPSQIYKAQLRGHQEDEKYRCLSTFNFNGYFDQNRNPFGKLKVLNDETLAPQQTQSFLAEKNESIILIPLVGTLDYTDGFGHQNYIETQQIHVLKTSENGSFQITNPYETELINYLQIRLESVAATASYFEKKPFSLEKRNELLPLFENGDCKISIGIFSGRSEAIYHLKSNENGVLAFVIGGAFEFQNRLLESRDSLSIWEVSEIELEALSENAMLLLIETPLQF